MNSWPLILTILAIHLTAVVTPGPNFFISAKHGLTYSRLAGLLTTTGVATGTLIHVTLGFLGFSALVAQSIWLYTLLKYMGAIYLIYLGVKTLLTRHRQPDIAGLPAESTHSIAPEQAYRTGLITCMTNPKSFIYFFALFTTIIIPDTPLTIKLLLLVLLPVISWLWYSLVALSFSLPQFRQGYTRFYGWIETSFGLLLIGLGLKIALSAK